MKRIDADLGRGTILLLFLFFFYLAPASLRAQSARLQLDKLDKLSAKAADVKDVALDGSTLQLASAFMTQDHDPQAVAAMGVIKGIKGIYVKQFDFAEPNEYSQADVDYVRDQFAAPGWNRLVESRDQKSGELNEVYIMKEGDSIGGMAILSAEPKVFTVVNIVGPLDLTKLASLAGNLGIPKDLSPLAQDKAAAASDPKAASGGSGAQKPPSQDKPAVAAGGVR
jgi:hypothetical protein